MPSSLKEGWKIPKEALDDFIQQRLPEDYTSNVVKVTNATIIVKEAEERIHVYG